MLTLPGFDPFAVNWRLVVGLRFGRMYGSLNAERFVDDLRVLE